MAFRGGTPPEERRCRAQTKRGERCTKWTYRRRDGEGYHELCDMHLGVTQRIRARKQEARRITDAIDADVAARENALLDEEQEREHREREAMRRHFEERLKRETREAAVEAEKRAAEQAEERRRYGSTDEPPELTPEQRAQGLSYAKSYFSGDVPEWQAITFHDGSGYRFCWRLITPEERRQRDLEDMIRMTPAREDEARERDTMIREGTEELSPRGALRRRIAERNRRGTDPLDPRWRAHAEREDDERPRNPITSEKLLRAYLDPTVTVELDVDLNAIPGYRS
jgi:hypothetical protein